MTILECIKVVLAENDQGLTAKDIHALIVERNLYSFGAEHPVSVVKYEIGLSTVQTLKIYRVDSDYYGE